MAIEQIAITSIKREPELQCRAKGTRAATVAEYAAALTAGADLGPVVVFRDGKGGTLRLADGFHRVAAAEAAGLLEVAADVREGGRKEALLYAASANGSHGLRRTAADKRRAVLALHEHPEWSKRAARWIAEQCKVSPTFASEVLKTVHGGQLPPTEGKDGKVRKPKTPAVAPKALDLGGVYLQIVTKHKRPADEHRQAFEAALVAAVATTGRRRIIPPSQQPAANGGE